MRKVNAIIERASDGNYSIYMDADDMSYLVTGTGKTEEEAIDVFLKGYEDMKAYYAEKGKEFEEVEFAFVRQDRDDKMTKASDYKCCKCGEPAVAFWPVCDPDIPSYPYCRKCLDKEKQELILAFAKIDEKYNRSGK